MWALVILFGQSCLCVTFTLCSTPSFGMLLPKFSNRNTHVRTSSIRMISFFTLQCELFTSCNVWNNTSLVSARTGVGGCSQPNMDRPGEGRGRFKNSQICTDILYGWPLRGKKRYWLVCAKHLPVVLPLFFSPVSLLFILTVNKICFILNSSFCLSQ